MMKKDMWRNPISTGVNTFRNFFFIFYLAMIALDTVDCNQKDLKNCMRNLNTIILWLSLERQLHRSFQPSRASLTTGSLRLKSGTAWIASCTRSHPLASKFHVSASLQFCHSSFAAACSLSMSAIEWTGFFHMVLGSLIYTRHISRDKHIAIGLIEYVNFWLSDFFFCGLVWGRLDASWPRRPGFYVHPGYWMNQATTSWSWDEMRTWKHITHFWAE